MAELDHGHGRILPRGRRAGSGLTALAVLAVLGACTAGGGDRADDAGDETASEAPAATAAPADDGAVSEGASAGAGGFPEASPLAGRSIVYTATVVVRSEDVPGDVRRATELVESRGGALFDSTISLEGTPAATLVLRVPPERLGDTLDALAALGRVQRRSQEAQDVTTQVLDLDSRIATARVSVERLRSFLADATSVADVAALETELVRRETELEQLVAQQRALADQVALATITLELWGDDGTAASVTGPVEATVGPVEALRHGIAVLGAIGLGIVLAAAWALPFVVVVVVTGLPVWLLWRRRPRRPRAEAGEGLAAP